jgi:sulfatase maturation enzyme AslB (radical SAM superfamily)
MNNGFEEKVVLSFDEFTKDKDGAEDFLYMLGVRYFLNKIGNVKHVIFLELSFSRLKGVTKWIYRNVDNDDWFVYESRFFKFTTNKSKTYHCFFSKLSGVNLRWGKTIDDDPKYCALGPEIMDLEISVNGCVPVPGSTNCRYCYKNNTTAPATNMTFETFEKIVTSFPRNLSQIAFGITGLDTNPYMEQMFRWCRENGIIPNVTTVGADLTPGLCNVLCKYCGAVAVSCYTGAKEHCYSIIKQLKDWAREKFHRDMHINMHIVVSKDNMEHVRSVLNDIKDGKVVGLKSVVFLRIKPKGRASHMDCIVPKEIYKEIVTFCMDNNIGFGFDSCSAYPVMEVLKELGKPELCDAAEPCESGFFSSYINVYGFYWNCSFAEGRTDFILPINVLEYPSSTIWWNSDKLDKIRNYKTPACKSCPIYNLDGDMKNE